MGKSWRPHLREWLVRIGLVAGSILLCLLGMEIALAVLDEYTPRPLTYLGEHENRQSRNFVVDPDVGWKMRPSYQFRWVTEGRSIEYKADAAGFRTGVGPADRPERPHRLLILGDSYMWGMGVPFPMTTGAVLESLLDEWQVDNLAMPGFGVDQIWQSVVHWGLPMAPDLVVVGLFTGDFERSLHAYRQTEGFSKPLFLVRDGELVKAVAGDPPGRLYRFIESHSRLLRLLQVAEQWSGRQAGIGGWWLVNEKILDAIIDDCARARTPVLFVHIPSRYEGGFPHLRAYMSARGAPLLEPFDLPAADRQQYYLREDGHLNAAGHGRLAALIGAWIRANLRELAGAP